ncbi:hypothetical protein V3H18_01260 [Methylocystis sp. 9N]|uniref:Efflux transporter periplasmic adaptor subunit n=1 Tax=Methylocystis borbori TaxID=3118750 RepID=A0ABU7XF02_9HYPH
MPLANSRIVPLAFWAAFLALGLFTSTGHDKPHAREAGKAHEVNLATAGAGKPLPASTIQPKEDAIPVILRD